MIRIEYKGKTYESRCEVAREYGIHIKTMQSRIDVGRTFEEAIEFRDSRGVEYEGVFYKNNKVLAEALGLDHKRLMRLKYKTKNVFKAIKILQDEQEQEKQKQEKINNCFDIALNAMREE